MKDLFTEIGSKDASVQKAGFAKLSDHLEMYKTFFE
jgi:hypothetical protein